MCMYRKYYFKYSLNLKQTADHDIFFTCAKKLVFQNVIRIETYTMFVEVNIITTGTISIFENPL